MVGFYVAVAGFAGSGDGALPDSGKGYLLNRLHHVALLGVRQCRKEGQANKSIRNVLGDRTMSRRPDPVCHLTAVERQVMKHAEDASTSQTGNQ